MSKQDLPIESMRNALQGLRYIFWGLVIFPFSFPFLRVKIFGGGILLIMICLLIGSGLALLARIQVNAGYRRAMIYLFIGLLLATTCALMIHFDILAPMAFYPFLVIVNYCIGIFGVAMRWLIRHVKISQAEKVWHEAVIWFMRLNVTPICLGALYILYKFLRSEKIYIYIDRMDVSPFLIFIFFGILVSYALVFRAYADTIKALKGSIAVYSSKDTALPEVGAD